MNLKRVFMFLKVVFLGFIHLYVEFCNMYLYVHILLFALLSEFCLTV